MAVKPILFSTTMVRAILEGRKTQTRRVIKPQPTLMFGIQGDIIQVYHTKGRCYCERDSFGKWRCAESNTGVTEQRLHGGFGRECILPDEIQRLWEKGIYGLVSVETDKIEQGILDNFHEPQRKENNATLAQTDMLGVSRGTETKEFAGQAPGWQQGEQPTREFVVGNTGGKLGRSEITRHGKCRGEALELKIHGRRTGSYSLGDRKRFVQSKACSAGLGSFSIRNIQHCPYAPGMTLWVRETWASHCDECEHNQGEGHKDATCIFGDCERYAYKADDDRCPGGKWRPSIFMPREAARIFLRVTDVRVERLQEILCGDMKREGCIPATVTGGQYQQWQRDYWIPLWDSTIKKQDISRYGWDANPWVWVISFERRVG